MGIYGENAACAYLVKQGYAILARNFRYGRYGEIDIIAAKDGTVSFVEVKTRASRLCGRPAEAVTWAKRRKIYRCAEYYLQCAGLLERLPALSFDVIEIMLDGAAGARLRHYPQCF